MWIADSEKGLYQPGCSQLHELDPRLKVAACLIFVILTFTAQGWASLALVALAISCAASLARLPLYRLAMACWRLRWLLLLTLLMHLFLTPGRTLFGLDWLSLDGLLQGLLVDAQILLALLSALLLAMTTSMESLAAAFGWFLAPLRILGFQVDAWQELFLRSLQFLPIVRDEARGIDPVENAADAGRGSRWNAWAVRLEGFILRLVERGDALARTIASGDSAGEAIKALPPLFPLAAREKLCGLLLVLLILLCRMTG